MSEGIHIPAFVVRALAIGMLALTVKVIWSQVPEARRYLKMEAM